MSNEAQVMVAGHICLDIIPSFLSHPHGISELLNPGKLIQVGSAVTSPGGAVSNCGLALNRLGIHTKLTGKVGNDHFGQILLDLLQSYDPSLVNGMVTEHGGTTSYSIVISPPGIDRIFFHCSGANDTFTADDVKNDQLGGIKLFHFGYPPIMRHMYRDNGAQLVNLLERIKAAGVIVSLDMAFPDPASEAGQTNWPVLLEQVLPYVDIFLPSLDEILYMLNQPLVESIGESSIPVSEPISSIMLQKVGDQLLEMGSAIIALKLGDQGLYIRTTSNAKRLTAIGTAMSINVSNWRGRELLGPCYDAHVVGTTGAGDCTIAGFLTGLLKGLSIEEVVSGALAVGAFSVESPDAVRAIPNWNTVQKRINAGWARRRVDVSFDNWFWEEAKHLWIGPADHQRQQL